MVNLEDCMNVMIWNLMIFLNCEGGEVRIVERKCKKSIVGYKVILC